MSQMNLNEAYEGKYGADEVRHDIIKGYEAADEVQQGAGQTCVTFAAVECFVFVIPRCSRGICIAMHKTA